MISFWDCEIRQKIEFWSVVVRDVKMGFDPCANPAHHGFEPCWVEKNSVFQKVGWTQPRSLNPRVKRVRAGL